MSSSHIRYQLPAHYDDPAHVLVYPIRRPLYPQRVPRAAEAPGTAQRRDGRIDQRPKGGAGFPQERIGRRSLPPAEPGGLPGRGLRQHLRPAANAADECAGQLLRDRPGGARRLAGAARPGQRGHHRDLHQLRAELRPTLAPACQPVQLHPGRPGRGRACFRDHRLWL